MATIGGKMFDVEIDTDALAREMTDTERRQMPFALMLTLNRTAEEAQRVFRDELPGRFTLRTPQSRNFLQRMARIPRGGRATKSKPFVHLAIDGDRKNVLMKHEEGGRITGHEPNPIYLPSRGIRPTKAVLPPRHLYPSSNRLVERRDPDASTLPVQERTTARGVPQIKGKRRMFVLDPKVHFGVRVWGVYQRTGPDRDDIRLLWLFRRSITLQPRLQFASTINRVVAQRFDLNFAGFLDVAMRTAR